MLVLFSEALLEESRPPREVAGKVTEYGNTREIGFMCLLRLGLAVAIRQAECRADRIWRPEIWRFYVTKRAGMSQEIKTETDSSSPGSNRVFLNET